MTRILVCGDRNWNEYDRIREVLNNFPKDSVIIHGGCKGADYLAGKIAKDIGMEVLVYQADWKKYGNRAGPIRNTQMINDGKPTIIIAFHHDIHNSKGTKDMIRQACNNNIDVILYD